jgi:hypothetical protein
VGGGDGPVGKTKEPPVMGRLGRTRGKGDVRLHDEYYEGTESGRGTHELH